MQEATRLTLAGDAAGAAALLQRALSTREFTGTDERAEAVEETVSSAVDAASLPTDLFLDGHFAHHDMKIDYKLFIPARAAGRPAPLLLMLHGCSQSADSFATSTRMNEIAEAAGMLVLYPTQSSSANANKCWNWFEPDHQRRGAGEPEILSALTRHVIDSQAIDPGQVFVAGFSAGAAMALILAEQYSDLYCAVGEHSGLPTGAASSNREAFSLMLGHAAGDTNSTAQTTGSTDTHRDSNIECHTPLIVFHGSQDRVVSVMNAERIIANWLNREMQRDEQLHWMPLPLAQSTADGHHCVVTTYVAESQPDRTGCEYWQLSEGGHGWSGGSPQGSFTEQNGPDASAEMVRFFLECVSAGAISRRQQSR